MTIHIEPSLKDMIVECYYETVEEALESGHSKLIAHKEGVTGASMLLSSMNQMEDNIAKEAVVALNLRPGQQDED